jgi:predicted NAD/FAD-dependent oxidoreductase
MSKGPQMLDAQYWRANIAGTELYVLTPAGTVKHRLPSGDTGFENLAAAGDWTKNGIDGGCVEAAAISGIEAANAIIARHRQPGDPAPVPPTHAHTDWLKGP